MSEDPRNSGQKKQIARIDVRGKDPRRWEQVRERLVVRISAMLDATLDHEDNTTVREEAKKFTSHMLEFARQRLQREGLENDKIEAEVSRIYAERTRELAEADRLSAEANEKRRKTALAELCAQLCMAKILIIGDQGEEAVLFGQQIDEFLRLVKEMNLLSEA